MPDTAHVWKRKREYVYAHLDEKTTVEHCSRCNGKRSVHYSAEGETLLFSHPPTLTDVCPQAPPSMLASVAADHRNEGR